MKKFDVSIYVTVNGEYNTVLFQETINVRGLPSKLLFALLTWIFKLTEGYTIEG